MGRKPFGSFRVGVVGAGGIARMSHLPGWRTIPDVSIVAIADIDESAAAAQAKAHSIPNVFTDYRDLLKLDLDAVDVCTPNLVHAPVVMAALKAGLHVLCEKPLAVTAKEVGEMGRLADKQKRILMTAQHYRFGAAGRAAKQWAKNGLGEVYHARVKAMRRAMVPTSAGFIDGKLAGGGPCMDIGVHALDMCLWLMGFPEPARVSGAAKVNFAKGHAIPGMWGEWDRKLFSVEDFAAGFIHYTNGATMTLETAWLGHQSEAEDLGCQVFGRKGGLKWPQGEFATVQAGNFVQGTLAFPTRIESAHTEVLRAFHDSVVKKKPSPVPWRETHKVIAILEAIYTSQAQGREVTLDLGTP